jgi:hypothetical protein
MMRATRVLLVALLCFVALGASDGQTVTLMGTVTLNGTAAQQGVRVVARSADTQQDCGFAMAGLEGVYSMPLSSPCEPGTSATVILLAAPDAATVRIDALTARTETDLAFTDLSDDALSAVARDAAAAGTPGDVTDTPTTGETIDRPASLLSESNLFFLLITIFGATILLLGTMVVTRFLVATQPFRTVKTTQDWSADRQAAWEKALAGQRDASLRVFPRFLIEGLVLAMVVIALLVLGTAGRVTQEGLVSVLAAIVGYAAGRAVKDG